jgi:hypothetical protein
MERPKWLTWATWVKRSRRRNSRLPLAFTTKPKSLLRSRCTSSLRSTGSPAFLYHGIVNTPTTGGAGGFTKSDSSGNIYFYDMEDSGSTPYYIYTLGAGEDWSVTVVGAVVTVTQLHTANKAISVAGCA